ncbi:MAG: TIGR03790 family protein [Armatimonadetes bacterium]|nr:TIGR03790 family protein [Armatimonadota bacterium]
MLIAAAISLVTATATIGCSSGPKGAYPPPILAQHKAGGPAVSKTIGVPVVQASKDSKRVLLIVNDASDDSLEIGQYYAAKRKIPAANVVRLKVTSSESVPSTDFETQILSPVKKAINSSKDRIDFIVTTKGVPLRIGGGNGYSVDAMLMGLAQTFAPIPESIGGLPEAEVDAAITRALNPYRNAKDRFSSAKYKLYLTTRLDGYEIPQIKKLIDQSLAAKPEKGPFFFDAAGNRGSGGYKEMQDTLFAADKVLKARGFQSELDDSDYFQNPEKPLMGYASWGSNDGQFRPAAYYALEFKPGALAETFVSTSGRTFNRTSGGQSLIADLIEQGVTGVKGYVSEPYTFALADPSVLFDRYTRGFNLAESFYAASMVCKWKDVVIGDPLCNPYAK